MGDWLAENRLLNIGLPVATLLSGAAFLGVLVSMALFSSGAATRRP